jgi:hypothetical protein
VGSVDSDGGRARRGLVAVSDSADEEVEESVWVGGCMVVVVVDVDEGSAGVWDWDCAWA